MIGYEQVRADAQRIANETKCLRRLFKHAFGYSSIMVPLCRDQYGSDLVGELITPETLTAAEFKRLRDDR